MADDTIIIQDILAIAIGILFMVFSIIIPKKLQQKNLISKYLARKLIHSFGGLIILVTPFLSLSALVIGLVLFWFFTILILLSKPDSKVRLFREIFNAVSESDEIQYGRLQGPFLYSLSIAIIFGVFAFFREVIYFPIAGGLVMMYADTLASVVGKKYGKHKIKIKWNPNARSVEGSLVFFIIAISKSV
jgi:phytol kinase